MILNGIPPKSGQVREDWILQAVCDGRAEYEFADIKSEIDDTTAVFRVFKDALKIDGVRVNVSAKTSQQIADFLGCSLLTPKLADLIWIQRSVTIAPHPQPITSDTVGMISHSAKIDIDLVKTGYSSGIVCTVGKHWCIDNDLEAHSGRAENYGWHYDGNLAGIPVEMSVAKDPSGNKIRVIQGRGWAHDMNHVDYSQVCVLVSKICMVNDQETSLIELLKDPGLSPLASHQGVMRIFRQPGVAEFPVSV